MGFLFGMKYQLIKSTETQIATQEGTNKQLNNSDNKTQDRFALMQLKSFKEEVLPKLASFSAEIKNETVRRVQNTSTGAWLVETMIKSQDYKPNLSETKSTVEYRNEYLVEGNEWIKLTEKPVLCYIEKSKIEMYQDNLSKESSKEGRLVLSGICNGGQYFISLYKYPSGEKINFSDSNGIILSKVMNMYLRTAIINSQGDIPYYSDLVTYGKEPSITVDFIKANSFEPPTGPDTLNQSLGKALFSIKTGKLLDVIDYSSF